jgi:hypothetical protein
MSRRNTLPDTGAQTILEVIAGMHEGVAIALDENEVSIGSAPKVDIMLGDHGVAAEHGIVRLQGSRAIIEASGGDIDVGRRHRVPRGHGCRATLPVDLRFGNAVLRIGRTPTARSWLSNRGGRWAIAGLACCVILILFAGFGADPVVGRLTEFAGTNPDTNAAASGEQTQAAKAPVAPNAASVPRAAPANVADELNSRIRNAGLVDVSLRLDGTRIVASGPILPEQRSAWGEIQRWFDHTHGEHYVLASEVEARAPAAPPKFDLQAISFGETPYVITADAQRRYPGNVIGEGWVIKEIRAGRLTLSKNGREIALSY